MSFGVTTTIPVVVMAYQQLYTARLKASVDYRIVAPDCGRPAPVMHRTCQYCGSVHSKDRCDSCGAPRRE